MKEEKSLHHVKGLPMSLVNSTKNVYDDNEHDEYGNESNMDVHISDTEEKTRIPEITSEELQDVIRKLKKDKLPDSDGSRAEDIKACDEETTEMVRQIFNEIVKQNEFTSEAWKKVKIKVLHKKGDVENVGNYRPIFSLPALYKLISTILYGRLYPRLDQEQAEDHAGSRSNDRLHESFRLHHSQINLESTQFLRY